MKIEWKWYFDRLREISVVYDERLAESTDFTETDVILRWILNKNNGCNCIIIMVIFWWVRQVLDFRGICEMGGLWWVILNCQKIYFCLDFQYFIEVTIEVNLGWFGELCENLIQFWSWRGSWTHPHPGAKAPMKYNVN